MNKFTFFFYKLGWQWPYIAWRKHCVWKEMDKQYGVRRTR